MKMRLKLSHRDRVLREPAFCVVVALGLSLRSVLAAAPPTSVPIVPEALESSPGETVNFFVSPDGDPPLFYQWQKNGVNLPAETNFSLTLTNLDVTEAGGYRAIAFNEAGALYSAEALLTVVLPQLPANDGFENGTAIRAAHNTVRGSSIGASSETGEPAHFQQPASNSVWYTWTAPGSGLATFDTRGSAFDTVLAVYTGNDLTSLTEVASDDDAGEFHTSRVQWNALEDQVYHVVIDGVGGQSGEYVCSWNLEITPDQAPILTLRPQSQTVPEGGTAWFRAAVSPQTGLSYQWWRNGQPIPSATSSNLALYNVQTADLGHYVMTVTNASGLGAATPPVVLEIGPDHSVYSRDKIGELTPPSGAGGSVALLAGTSGGTFSLTAGTIINQRFFNDGTSDRCEPPHCQQPGGASRWFQLAPAEDGMCFLDTEGSDVDTVLAVYVQNFGICTQLFEPLVGCNNDVVGDCPRLLGPTNAWDRTSRFAFFAAAGTVYRAVVDTAFGVRGTNVHFNVRFQPAAPTPPAVLLDATNRHWLVRRGDTLTLGIRPELAPPKSTLQWRRDNRDIAGANQSILRLPRLNFSDAARYSVIVRHGSQTNRLPGIAIAVADLCSGVVAGETTESGSSLMLIGSLSESALLRATEVLDPDVPWTVLGTLPVSRAPYVWRVSREPAGYFQIQETTP